MKRTASRRSAAFKLHNRATGIAGYIGVYPALASLDLATRRMDSCASKQRARDIDLVGLDRDVPE